MKSLYKIILLGLSLGLTHQSWGRDIVLISYGNPQQKDLAKKAVQIVINDLGLPKEFTRTSYSANPCRPIGRALAQFCFDQNNDLQVVVFDHQTIARSLRLFLEDKEIGNEK